MKKISRGVTEKKIRLLWEKKGHIMLEGSQARPSCPSDKSNAKMKTLEWLKTVFQTGAVEFLFPELVPNFTIWKWYLVVYTAHF
jgi:hypothetical protein